MYLTTILLSYGVISFVDLYVSKFHMLSLPCFAFTRTCPHKQPPSTREFWYSHLNAPHHLAAIVYLVYPRIYIYWFIDQKCCISTVLSSVYLAVHHPPPPLSLSPRERERVRERDDVLLQDTRRKEVCECKKRRRRRRRRKRGVINL